MKENVTVGEKTFWVDYSISNGKWRAVVIMQPPTNNQLYALPAPWSCEADTEEELRRKLKEHFDAIGKTHDFYA